MGVWGTAVFSDDTACDVRDDYQEYVGDGLSGPEATDRLLDEWQDRVLDPDEGPVFWLALAATQWRCGRLESRVQQRALEVIGSGSDLRRWAEDPKLQKKRHAVLARLEEQLRSPLPPVRRIPKRFLNHCEWEVGEIIGYRLGSGNWALLRVIDFHADKGGTSPIFEMLDWVGKEIPPQEVLQGLPVRRTDPNSMDRPNELIRFMIGRTREKELPIERVRRLGIKLAPVQKRPQGRGSIVWPVRVYLWRFLDASLARDFGLV
jgi:hypothetical protein